VSTTVAEPAKPAATAVPTRRTAIAAVIGAAVLFGTTGTAKAKGPSTTDAYVAGALRLAIGGPLLWWYAKRRNPAAARPPWPTVLASGACVAMYQVCFFAGLDRTGVAVGTVIAIGAGPIFAGILGAVAFGERPTMLWGVSTALAVAGGIVISGLGGSAQLDVVGAVLVLCAGLGYAGYTVVSRSLVVKGYDASTTLGMAFTTGAMLVAPIYVLRPVGWVFTGRGLLLTLFLGVFPTFVAYALFAVGLRTLSGATVTTFVLAEPATAVLLARFVLGEDLVARHWIGIGLVMAGVALLAIDPARYPVRTRLRSSAG
jgi:drug/metabolite transporter, DME family